MAVDRRALALLVAIVLVAVGLAVLLMQPWQLAPQGGPPHAFGLPPRGTIDPPDPSGQGGDGTVRTPTDAADVVVEDGRAGLDRSGVEAGAAGWGGPTGRATAVDQID